MAREWKEIRRRFAPKVEAQIGRRVAIELKKLPLAQLRAARELTQLQISTVLQTNQGAISKLEKRADMRLSTLRSYVEAMGGRLDVRAVFPDSEILLERTSRPSASRTKKKTSAANRRISQAA